MGVLSTIILIGLLGCSIFGAIYLRVWVNRRDKLAYLFVSLSSFSVAVFAAIELPMMHTTSIPELIRYRHFSHLCAWLIMVSFALFVRYYLDSGRLWLFLAAVGLRTVTVIVDAFSPFTINYTNIESIHTIRALGEELSVVVGTPNPLMLIAQISLLLYLAFCADASWSVWRRGERRVAVTLGGSIVFFSAGALVWSVLVMWRVIDFPLLVSPFFIGIIVAMGYEISSQVLRAHALSTELDVKNVEAIHRIQELGVAANAGNVGVWMRDLDTGKIWASDKWREIFGFSLDEDLMVDKFFERVVPADRERIRNTFREATESDGIYEAEYRLELPDGRVRWIDSHGKLGTSAAGSRLVYGASADITKRKLAELSIHDLGGRLIGAQEVERARLARELHDDLSQNLALLSIRLEMLGNGAKSGADFEQRIRQLSDHVQTLSLDVHRISHELHPAKLEQLGLVPAIRGFCREIENARGLKVKFTHGDMPQRMPKEVALCLYRVTQEALQNVQKHSGANLAQVDIMVDDKKLRLTVFDDGVGFDTDSPRENSLGLTSMHERVLSVKGSLTINSRPGQGTTIKVTIPTEFA